MLQQKWLIDGLLGVYTVLSLVQGKLEEQQYATVCTLDGCKSAERRMSK